MNTDLEPRHQGVTAIPGELTSGLRDIIAGAPPVSHWRSLIAWLAAHGESPGTAEVTGAWLVSRRTGSDNTRDAYACDMSRWFLWCAARGVTAATAGPTDADLFAAAHREAGLSDATTARRLASISSWYKYAIRAEVAPRNPLDGMDRPKVPATSSVRGITKREFAALIKYAAEHESPRTHAILMTMAATAARIGALLAADVSDLGQDSGYQVLDLTKGKGRKAKRYVLPAPTVEALERFLGGRTEGPLFATASGKRMYRQELNRVLKRAAGKAGIPHAAEISTHRIRHTVATILLSTGHELHIVQGLLDHEDARTTKRYDDAFHNLDRSPANDMAQIIGAEIRLLAAEE